MSEQRVTLQPGDYVSTDGMSEETYHRVMAALMNAGAPRGRLTHRYDQLGYCGWDADDNKVNEWKTASNTAGRRQLTVDQVLNATNAGGTPVQPAPSEIEQALSDPDHPYHDLADVLEQAFRQASGGKGRERHANDLPFNEQRMQTIARGQGHCGGLVYQICKKAQESERLPRDAALRELLGVIVYAGGAFIYRKGDE